MQLGPSPWTGPGIQQGLHEWPSRAEDEPMKGAGNSEPQTRGQQSPPAARTHPEALLSPLRFRAFAGRHESTDAPGPLSPRVPPPVTQRQPHAVASRAIQDAELASSCYFISQTWTRWPIPRGDLLAQRYCRSQLVTQEPARPPQSYLCSQRSGSKSDAALGAGGTGQDSQKRGGAGHWTSSPGS